MRALSHSQRPAIPAAALVATGGISSQCGAALATKLFSQVGPSGALTLRLLFATVALLLVARPRTRDLRRLLHPSHRVNLIVVIAFGLALAGMNLSFYEAIARIPLGVAVTVEFVGPLAIALAGSRRWTDMVWALLAAGGVVLLASGALFGVVHHLDLAGVGFAASAGSLWAAYILLNKETGKRFPRTTGLAGAMAVGTVVIAPIGAWHAGAAILRPSVIGTGAAVALLSSAIPYSCEMAALRRATPRAFGILLSMAPALAALAGLVLLGQRLSVLELGALVLVVVANVGSSWIGSGSTVPVPSPDAVDVAAGAEPRPSPNAEPRPSPDAEPRPSPDAEPRPSPAIMLAHPEPEPGCAPRAATRRRD
jgi:inner membrane transporter RhtA